MSQKRMSPTKISARKVEQGSDISPEELRALLTTLGVTQRAAAAFLGVTPRAISHWLDGNRPIKKRTMLALERMAPKSRRRAVVVSNAMYADSISAMKSMKASSVNLVVTSPPYNAEKEYEEKLTVEEYTVFAERWLKQVPRILAHNGALWLNVGYMKLSKTETLPLTYLYYGIAKRCGLSLVQEIVWHKEVWPALHSEFRLANRALDVAREEPKRLRL